LFVPEIGYRLLRGTYFGNGPARAPCELFLFIFAGWVSWETMKNKERGFQKMKHPQD